jgi:putative transposase
LQFTSNDFTGILLGKGIKISIDGRGRVFNNIFTERLWRSVKYEEVYIKDYEKRMEMDFQKDNFISNLKTCINLVF